MDDISESKSENDSVSMDDSVEEFFHGILN